MAGVTGKRKREDAKARPSAFKKAATKPKVNGQKKAVVVDPEHDGITKAASKLSVDEAVVGDNSAEQPLFIQIVTGSYERVLHGFSASIPTTLLQEDHASHEDSVSFSDTFLFAAHTASIRCLAISPPTGKSSKRYLATGSADERINTYSISTVPSSAIRQANLPSLGGSSIAENTSNRALGSLIQHDRAITRLVYPGKGKLFSAAEDNTIAIARTGDGVVLSSFKAPIPKAQGRPSGDTAGPGEVPTGVNDFAIHPIPKVMLSVSRGERSLRLWNLMTGKKAGVLNFDRDLLVQVGEGKHSSGEGRRVLWGGAQDSYVVGFERGAVFFGNDSMPRAVVRPLPPTKLHQMHFLPGSSWSNILAVSTEDGRVLFYDMASTVDQPASADGKKKLPACKLVAQLGGKDAGISGRVKDFGMIPISSNGILVTTASSDGTVRLWYTKQSSLIAKDPNQKTNDTATATKQVGQLIGTHETGNRITCLEAFPLDGKASEAAEEDEVEDAASDVEDKDSSSEED